MRPLGVLVALALLMTACGSRTHGSPIRVTLTAQTHHPLLHLTGLNHQPPPSEQWGYCVKISTATGKPVPAPTRLHLRILSGRAPVGDAGLVSLRKGYDRWCGSIGGEYNVLEAVPRGKPLVFQAVVRTMGVTVERNWPLVVRAVR
jgi:hypothetical protein